MDAQSTAIRQKKMVNFGKIRGKTHINFICKLIFNQISHIWRVWACSLSNFFFSKFDSFNLIALNNDAISNMFPYLFAICIFYFNQNAIWLFLLEIPIAEFEKLV